MRAIPLRLICLCVVVTTPALLLQPAAADDVPMAGKSGPETASFDAAIPELMRRYGVPGGSLAVARDGKLVVARGYGFADVKAGRKVEPTTPFRLASLTKPITHMAVLALVDRGRLALDMPVAPLLRGALPLRVAAAEGTLAAVTVRHLLLHTGGWGPRERLGFGIDPVLHSALQAKLGREIATHFDLLAAAWSLPPEATPGARYEYSTFGTCTLGALIEVIEARALNEVWRDLLFDPVRARSFALAAADWAGGRPAPDEARYYDPPGSPRTRRRTASGTREYPRPDAYWEIRKPGVCVGGGRLVANAPDYLRVMLAAGGRRGPQVLSDASRGLFFDPHPNVLVAGNEHRTHGLFFYPATSGGTWAHTGGMPGAATWYSRSGRYDVVALFNLQPEDRGFYGELVRVVWHAVNGVRDWPGHDLFE